MHWRPFHPSDLLPCLEMQPACLGDALIGREGAIEAWRSLLDQPAFLATVIEAERPLLGSRDPGTRIAGCGLGVFVTRAFADHELADPKPGLNDRILASLSSSGTGSDSVVLDRDAIAQGNAGPGVDFVNLYGTWRDGVLTLAELTEVQVLLGKGFAEQFSGYRFNRVIKEAIGADRIALARATGTYRVICEYGAEHDAEHPDADPAPDPNQDPHQARALVVATPASLEAAPYSVAATIYRYRPPVLRLRPAEQELLQAALSGQTDAELSSTLGVSVEATKKRWLSVFDRVVQYKPEILSAAEESEGRGPQKRHRIVAYVRSHPEELRPYSWR